MELEPFWRVATEELLVDAEELPLRTVEVEPLWRVAVELLLRVAVEALRFAVEPLRVWAESEPAASIAVIASAASNALNLLITSKF